MLYKLLLNRKPWQIYAIKIIIFFLLCIATILFFFCITAFVLVQIDTPEYILIPLTTTLLALSSFIDSFIISKVLKENGLFTGIFIGFVFTLITIALSLYYKTFALTSLFLTKTAAVLFSGMFGGILGVNS